MVTDREELIGLIKDGLGEPSWLVAAWLGGSDATGRVDRFSDVDLQLVVGDDAIEKAFSAIESILGGPSGIDHYWRVAEPTWHGHAQAVFRPRGAPGHLCLDLLVIQRSAADWFFDPERHGDAVIISDRERILGSVSLDRVSLTERRRLLLQHHAQALPIVLETVAKSIQRGHVVEAIQGYHQNILRPLIDLLRCEHCPDRFDFGFRYLDRDLPPTEQEMLTELASVGGLPDLVSRFNRARNEIMTRLERLQAGGEAVPPPGSKSPGSIGRNPV